MRAQSAVPHALDDLAQLGAIGLDDEAEGRAATQVSSSHGGRGWSRSRIWAVNASTAAETKGVRGRTAKMPASRDPSTDGRTRTNRPAPSSPLTSQSERSATPTPESASSRTTSLEFVRTERCPATMTSRPAAERRHGSWPSAASSSCEDILQSDPNTRHVAAGLAGMECVVVHDLFLNETATYAHVFLPGSTFLEKNGTFTNAERRIQRVRKVMRPLNGYEDWEITQMLSNALGWRPGACMRRLGGRRPRG